MKINLLNTVTGLVPLTDDDYDEKKKLKIGEVYQVDIKKLRNIRFHRLYFALINCSWEYCNEKQAEFFKNDKNVFRKSMEVSAGHCDTVYSVTKKEWQDVPRSISFEKMDEFEFRDLYDKVKNVLFATVLRNISMEEFERNLSNF